jgi:hypothetical protein
MCLRWFVLLVVTSTIWALVVARLTSYRAWVLLCLYGSLSFYFPIDYGLWILIMLLVAWRVKKVSRGKSKARTKDVGDEDDGQPSSPRCRWHMPWGGQSYRRPYPPCLPGSTSTVSRSTVGSWSSSLPLASYPLTLCGDPAYHCMCSMQVVDITPMKHSLTSITLVRVVQQKHRRSKVGA